MGNGSDATKQTAQLVLLDSDFAVHLLLLRCYSAEYGVSLDGFGQLFVSHACGVKHSVRIFYAGEFGYRRSCHRVVA